MSWIKEIFDTIRINITETGKRKAVTSNSDDWIQCTSCLHVTLKESLPKNLYSCDTCGKYIKMPARQRILSFLDKDSMQEISADMTSVDILKFKDTQKYSQRIATNQEKSGEKDALITAIGLLDKRKIIVAAFEFSFMGGSMGSVVGDKFVAAAEMAIKNNCPLVCFSASGGARMQENMFSLMQMARTSASIAKLKELNIPYISVLTNPTFGGVSASLAMLGHINIAEPNALIGFAGARVIEQTVKQKLPEGFQTSEFLLERGAIDCIVDRKDIRHNISSMLAMMLDNK
jgi:acetyl-CoA carboxylase carboxyl transferase subunit beta